MMTGSQRPAAYHGTGWRPRTGTLRDDLHEGVLWHAAGANSEWAPLEEVMLALPSAHWSAPSDWNAVLYLGPVDFHELRKELVAYATTLSGLGVRVATAELPEHGEDGPPYNGIFVRDQSFMTPEGAVVARMGSAIRAAEARWATAALGCRGVPIIRTVGASGCFEGADALWLRPNLVALGVGNRTNAEGAAQVAALLQAQGVETTLVPLSSGVQHLLGLLQLVAPDLAVVRTALAPPSLIATLAHVGVEIVPVPESESVTRRQAVNFVTVAPRSVVMVAGSPEIRAQLTRSGVEVAAEIPCPQLLMCAGGLACVTGILKRRLISPDEVG